jgi:stearoyl-CoA desaturase (delta-9 desaturase)
MIRVFWLTDALLLGRERMLVQVDVARANFERRSNGQRAEKIALLFLVLVPFMAVLSAVPVAWGWGLGWHDIVIATVMYLITGFGITVGFHRYLTHGSFKAKPPLAIALAVMGSLAIEGRPIDWVSDHRKHHRFSDENDDPHSPWRHGSGFIAQVKGIWHAHTGWLFTHEQASSSKYAPDLLKDKHIVRVNQQFVPLLVTSLVLPAVVGGLWSLSWQGAVSAFFWASLVRVALLHHVTWSINSICHMFGKRPFRTRDQSRNVWWLSLPSFGESWHNLHHAEPTSARHGALKGQIDPAAMLIRMFEKFGWASDVKWPRPERLASLRNVSR